MSAERQPARERYDAVVDLGPEKRGSDWAYALVKHTFRLRGDRWALAKPEPLQHDLRDEEIEPRVTPDTDFWPWKELADVVVRGSAYGARGRRFDKRLVTVRVGRQAKQVAVFGPRAIRWDAEGRPRIGAPEPVESVPLDWWHAYGGIDYRVPVPDENTVSVQLRLHCDHPGLYPRNPFGLGYFVEEGALEGAFMPQLEDPQDLLTRERLIAGDPRAWTRQPLPWCFDWVHPVMYPRVVFFGMGADAWYPAPDESALPEVRRGFVEPGFRQRRSGGSGRSPVPDTRFFQAASHGMSFGSLRAGTPVELEGLHPERERLKLAIPRPPRIQLSLGDKRLSTEVRLHHLVVRPDEEIFTLVHGARAELGRTMIPGIHKHIPLAVQVEKDAPIHYEAPPQIMERIAAGKAEADAELARRRGGNDDE